MCFLQQSEALDSHLKASVINFSGDVGLLPGAAIPTYYGGIALTFALGDGQRHLQKYACRAKGIQARFRTPPTSNVANATRLFMPLRTLPQYLHDALSRTVTLRR